MTYWGTDSNSNGELFFNIAKEEATKLAQYVGEVSELKFGTMTLGNVMLTKVFVCEDEKGSSALFVIMPRGKKEEDR